MNAATCALRIHQHRCSCGYHLGCWAMTAVVLLGAAWLVGDKALRFAKEFVR